MSIIVTALNPMIRVALQKQWQMTIISINASNILLNLNQIKSINIFIKQFFLKYIFIKLNIKYIIIIKLLLVLSNAEKTFF